MIPTRISTPFEINHQIWNKHVHLVFGDIFVVGGTLGPHDLYFCSMLMLTSMFLRIFIESNVAIWHIYTVSTFVFFLRVQTITSPQNIRWTSNWTKWTELWKLSLWMSSRPRNLSTLEKMWDSKFIINIIVVVVIILVIIITIIKQHWRRCDITNSSSKWSSKLSSSEYLFIKILGRSWSSTRLLEMIKIVAVVIFVIIIFPTINIIKIVIFGFLFQNPLQVMIQHAFARDSLEPKCTELKIMCKRQVLWWWGFY